MAVEFQIRHFCFGLVHAKAHRSVPGQFLAFEMCACFPLPTVGYITTCPGVPPTLHFVAQVRVFRMCSLCSCADARACSETRTAREKYLPPGTSRVSLHLSTSFIRYECLICVLYVLVRMQQHAGTRRRNQSIYPPGTSTLFLLLVFLSAFISGLKALWF